MDNLNTSISKIEFNEENKNFNKQRKHGKRKIFSYVIVGLICSVIGGTVSTAASLYLLPKWSLFKNTPLYESMVQTNNKSYISASPMSNNGTSSVSEIAKKVGPAVVGVSVKTSSQDNAFSGSKSEEGMGSGIIISEEGYILTNYHVINSAEKVSVIFNNNKEISAKIINYDEALDLAVIKVTDNIKMPAVAELGNSKDLQVGDSVVAIGNPLGKELLGSVTTGVISAVNREIKVGNSKQTFLQTDAAINPGNSGGALVNSSGKVIGINSAKMGGNGVEGLGFAIPIDTVKPKIDSLLKPILKIGISGRDISPEMSKSYSIPEGVYVVQVQEFTAAEKCGLQTGDIIKKFDNKLVKSINDINSIKSNHKSGDKVKIEIFRDGKTKTLTLNLTD